MRVWCAALLTLAIAAPSVPSASGGPAAPGYRVSRGVGDHPFLFEFRTVAAAAFTPPADNALSAWQPLPFPWKFFGAPVEGYFISDNGYVTFDRSAKTSAAASTALDAASAPRRSIFAFWTDMRLEAGHGQWVGHVYTATMGAAPNRLHAIYWMGPIPAGETFDRSSYNFLLVLHENGEFEVIFASGRKGAPVRATVGATNADGTLVATAEGPGFDYPPVGYGGDDDVAYRFTPIEK